MVKHIVREAKPTWRCGLVLCAFVTLTLGVLPSRTVGQAQGVVASEEFPDCQATVTVTSGDSLEGLSEFYFGEGYYAPTILLATNARAGRGRFPFISDPNQLRAGTQICIPGLQEAEKLRHRYETYQQAVYEMVAPRPQDASHALLAIDPTRPVRVVAWVRPDQIARLRQANAAPYDIWVTVVPHVKVFCRAFSEAHGAHLGQLILRIEQRLGLPPGSGKSTFVEILVKNPADIRNLFRPCAIPAISATTCQLGPPDASTSQEYRMWFFSQYYSSYARTRSSQYPWTTLGYTFDWAPRELRFGDTDFVRDGESEFVIPEGGQIQIESISETADYCSQRE